MIHNEHDGNTRDFTNTSLQVLIARGDDVAAILHITQLHKANGTNTLNEAVISVCALVRARKTLNAGILRQAKSEVVARSKLFQFSHNAVCDIGNALSEQTVH